MSNISSDHTIGISEGVLLFCEANTMPALVLSILLRIPIEGRHEAILARHGENDISKYGRSEAHDALVQVRPGASADVAWNPLGTPDMSMN